MERPGLPAAAILGVELFPGNNLIVVSAMARRWMIVYFSNFIGWLLLALIFYSAGLWKSNEGVLGAPPVSRS
jgi:formate/nitrite transporter FocA (FNT family)